jgi:hypothetical protein
LPGSAALALRQSAGKNSKSAPRIHPIRRRSKTLPSFCLLRE